MEIKISMAQNLALIWPGLCRVRVLYLDLHVYYILLIFAVQKSKSLAHIFNFEKNNEQNDFFHNFKNAFGTFLAKH